MTLHQIPLHNLVTIELDMNHPWFGDLLALLGDVPALVPEVDTPHPQPRLKVHYVPRHQTGGLRPLGDDLLIGRHEMIDRIYGVRLTTPDHNTILLESPGPALEWLMWALQLVLLKSRATFLHGAGLMSDEGAILFPSWGGVGKTALSKYFLENTNWSLLGDDLLIIKEDRQCFSFPKPLVLYSYHQPIFPEIFSAHKGPVAPTILDNALTQIARKIKPLLRRSPRLLQFARRHNPQSVRINPHDLFGSDRLARSGPISDVIWLDRIDGLEHLQLRRADESVESRAIGATLHEFDKTCVNLTNVAFGLGILSFSDVYETWAEVTREALKGATHWILCIPLEMSLADVPDAVATEMAQVGII